MEIWFGNAVSRSFIVSFLVCTEWVLFSFQYSGRFQVALEISLISAYTFHMLHRDIENLIRENMDEYPSVTVYGPRQCGKTTLARAMYPDFSYANLEDLNTKLLGLSVDSLNSHIAWLKDMKENISHSDFSDFDTDFPLIEDENHSIAQKYGMIQPKADTTKTVRAVFIIDPRGIIRAILYYPQTNGRNIEEIKRLLIALQTTDKFSVVTPANWEAGDEVIITPPSTKEEAIERLENMDDTKCYDWFLCFKKLPRESIEEKLICEECGN